MTTTFDEKIPFTGNGLDFYGLLKRGTKPQLPLIVLFHGGGTTPAYFDNPVVSVVKDLNNLGHNVLNISRPGYGRTPVPKTTTPFKDSIPAFISFIEAVYAQITIANGTTPGIILVGHSIGGSLALSITHEAKDRLPIIGISVMGSLPSKGPLDLFPGLDDGDGPDAGNPRYITEPSAENIRRFMGEVEWLHPEALSEDVISAVFEPGIKSELREYLAPETNGYLLDVVLPGITVPVQFLAAQVDIIWDCEDGGRPIFDDLVKRFSSAPSIDEAILPGGGHNYEFCKNVGVLRERREGFIAGLVAKRG
ncbi:Alpha/Beta hydrolase protein [Aspergillus venezuelensis]